MSKKQHRHFVSVDLHLNENRQVSEVRYLGVLITADLTWSTSGHCENVIGTFGEDLNEEGLVLYNGRRFLLETQ